MSLTAAELKMIGGSDGAALLGVNKRKRPIDIFRRIMDGKEPDDVGNRFAIRRGVLLEPVIRQMAQEELGLELLGPRKLRHPTLDFVRASLDDVANVNGEPRVVEYKSVNARVANDYGTTDDEIPETHICQVQWYLGCSGWSVGYLVALLGGDELRAFTLLANKDLQAALFEAAERFWVDHILTGIPPPVDGSASYGDFNAANYRSTAEVLVADESAERAALEYRAASEAFDAAEAEKKRCRQILEQLLLRNGASKLHGNFGKISWTRTKDGIDTDWEAIAKEMSPPETLIQKHTAPRQGHLVFKPTWSNK